MNDSIRSHNGTVEQSMAIDTTDNDNRNMSTGVTATNLAASLIPIFRSFQFVVPVLLRMCQCKPIEQLDLLPPPDSTRKTETEKLVELIQKTELRGIILCGRIGIGKTILARRVLHHQAIQEKYGIWRLEVSLIPQITDLAELIRKILGRFEHSLGNVATGIDDFPKEKLLKMLENIISETGCIVILRNALNEHRTFIIELLRIKSLFVLITTPSPGFAYDMKKFGLTTHIVEPFTDNDAITMLYSAPLASFPADKSERLASAQNLARMLNNFPMSLKKAIEYLTQSNSSIYSLIDQLSLTANAQSQWLDDGLSKLKVDVLKSMIATLSRTQKLTLVQLSEFVPAPAIFEASRSQEMLFEKKLFELSEKGLLVRVAQNRYFIEYHVQVLIRALLVEEDFSIAPLSHSEYFAQIAFEAHDLYIKYGQGFAKFRLNRENINKGWLWALNQQEINPSKKTQDLLVKYAESITYLDPFYNDPQEKIKRFDAALRYPSFDKIDPSNNSCEQSLIDLRNILAVLYGEESSIRRIVSDSGINPATIAFNSGSAINIWHFVLSEAQKVEKIEALLIKVENEYGANYEFQKAYNKFRYSQRLIYQNSWTERITTENLDLWVNLAQAYLDFGQVSTAKKYLERLLEIVQENSIYKCAVFIVLGNLHSKYDYSDDEIELRKKYYDTKLAEGYYLKCQSIAQRFGYERYNCYAQLGFAELSNRRSSVRKAIEYYVRSLEIAVHLKDTKIISKCLIKLTLLLDQYRGNSESNMDTDIQLLVAECHDISTQLYSSTLIGFP